MPMSDKLKALFNDAEKMAVDLFMKYGQVGPTYLFVDREGNHGVVPMPPPPLSKGQAIALVRALFELKGATMMAFFDEAWGLTTTIDEEAPGDLSVNQDPRRREVIHFSAEELDGGFYVGERPIIREPGKRPRPGPLEVHEFTHSEGRMVGMLPQPKGRVS